MKVVFCASEVYPFIKTGGLADVIGTLPLALEKLGCEIDIYLPFYKGISSKHLSLKTVDKGIKQTLIGDHIRVLFIDNKDYFHRDGVYGNESGDFVDNFDRFQYFTKRVLDHLSQSHKRVHILHCHDWHTALFPVYLNALYRGARSLKKTKTVMTIHNLAFQGVFEWREHEKLIANGIQEKELFEFYGKMNLLKAGISSADAVTTVSSQYAEEIQTKEFGCGLDEILKDRKTCLTGILNGIDYHIWNPRSDENLEHHFSAQNYQVGKAKNKQQIQKKLGLPEKHDIPMFGYVGRISHQKGIDLMLDVFPKLLEKDIQIVLQGLGDESMCQKLSQMAEKHSNRMAVCFEFDEPLAHRIYAGSDFFLMPSVFEPCGLSQIISMRYGTVPIAHRIGGLADTVQSYFDDSSTANGFLFDKYNSETFSHCLFSALEVFEDTETMEQIIQTALSERYNWKRSAQQYKELYQCLLSA